MKDNRHIILVGKPNSGKSMLFNKLVQQNVSIVSELENTTTDYISISFGDSILSDSCGLLSLKDFHKNEIDQIDLSADFILKNDLILYVIDGSIPVSSLDIELVKLFRKKEKDIFLIINKVDLKTNCNFRVLGIPDYLFISAKENIGIQELKEKIGLETLIDIKKPIISIIGRCNSGKSSLLNAILKENRSKVSSTYGTTRDSVLVESGKVMYMDTAGYKREDDFLEHITACRRHNSLTRSTGILLVLDGEIGITDIDKKLISEARRYGQFVIIIINKKDLVINSDSFSRGNFGGIPITYASAKEGKIGTISKMIFWHLSKIRTKISTRSLNNNLLIWKEKNPILKKVKYLCQGRNLKFMYSSSIKLPIQVRKNLAKKIINYYNLGGSTIFLEKI